MCLRWKWLCYPRTESPPGSDCGNILATAFTLHYSAYPIMDAFRDQGDRVSDPKASPDSCWRSGSCTVPPRTQPIENVPKITLEQNATKLAVSAIRSMAMAMEKSMKRAGLR